MSHYKWQSSSQLHIYCLIQAGKKTDQVIGIHDQRLKIKVAAPASEGKANKRLLKLFSRWCAVPKSRVEILKGLTSHQKTIAIVEPKNLPDALEIKAQ